MEPLQKFYRGDLWMVDVPKPDHVSSIQYGKRPYLIVWSNDFLQDNPSQISCIATTTKTKKPLPVHVHLPKGTGNLRTDSTLLIETVDMIPTKYFLWKIGHIDEGSDIFRLVEKALMIQFDIDPEIQTLFGHNQ